MSAIEVWNYLVSEYHQLNHYIEVNELRIYCFVLAYFALSLLGRIANACETIARK